jgi:hypothetical protein
MFKVLGSGDDVTVCDCCGRKNLKLTVALENEATGEQVRYGRDCAAAAVLGVKNAKNADQISSEAKALNIWNSFTKVTAADFDKAGNEVFNRTGRVIWRGFDGVTRHAVTRKGKVVKLII